MIIRKFIKSLSNKEKGELIRALADEAYRGKGIVFDYLYELAGFIESEPDKKEEPVIKEVIKYRYKNRALDLPAITMTDEEKRLIRDDQLVRAVRMMRERTAQRLTECHAVAKAYQESISEGQEEERGLRGAPVVAAPNLFIGGDEAVRYVIDGVGFTSADVATMKASFSSNKIAAIKWVREQGYERNGRSIGLREAKDFVDSLGM